MVYQAIKDYLVQKGISQSFVAKSLGISRQQLSASLNGKRGISAEEYIDICRALNVPLEQFAT